MKTPIALIAILAACVTQAPEAQPQTVHKVYLPLVFAPQNKAGVVWTVGNATQGCADLQMLGASWSYQYNTHPPECPGVEMIPHITGAQAVGEPIDSEYIMLFSENDGHWDTAQTPAEAAVAWRLAEMEYPDAKLVGPAPIQLQWTIDMIAEYEAIYGEPPRIHALGVHCYASFEFCKGKVLEAAALGYKVWVTEYGVRPCYHSNWQYEAEAMLAWMDTNPVVERYAWFANRVPDDASWGLPGCQTPLLDFDTGELTELGELWITNAP